MFRRIGIDNVKTTFMIPINQVRWTNFNLVSEFLFIYRMEFQLDKTTEHLLETVNKIITVGVADNLFTQAEKDRIIDDWHKHVNGDTPKQ